MSVAALDGFSQVEGGLEFGVAGDFFGAVDAAAEEVAFEGGFIEAVDPALQAALGTLGDVGLVLEGGGQQVDVAEAVVLGVHGVHAVDESFHLPGHLVVIDGCRPADDIGIQDTVHDGRDIVLEDAGAGFLARQAANAEFDLFAAQRDELYLMPSSFIDRATVPILKKYLNNERLSLTQIADLMNFTSLSYFSRYCTKHLGQSPSDYRLSLQPK